MAIVTIQTSRGVVVSTVAVDPKGGEEEYSRALGRIENTLDAALVIERNTTVEPRKLGVSLKLGSGSCIGRAATVEAGVNLALDLQRARHRTCDAAEPIYLVGENGMVHDTVPPIESRREAA